MTSVNKQSAIPMKNPENIYEPDYFSGTGSSQSSSAVKVTACKSRKVWQQAGATLAAEATLMQQRWLIYLFIYLSFITVKLRKCTVVFLLATPAAFDSSLNRRGHHCQTKYCDTQSRALQAGKVGREKCSLKKLQNEKTLYPPLCVFLKPSACTFKLDLDRRGRNPKLLPHKIC